MMGNHVTDCNDCQKGNKNTQPPNTTPTLQNPTDKTDNKPPLANESQPQRLNTQNPAHQKNVILVSHEHSKNSPNQKVQPNRYQTKVSFVYPKQQLRHLSFQHRTSSLVHQTSTNGYVSKPVNLNQSKSGVLNFAQISSQKAIFQPNAVTRPFPDTTFNGSKPPKVVFNYNQQQAVRPMRVVQTPQNIVYPPPVFQQQRVFIRQEVRASSVKLINAPQIPPFGQSVATSPAKNVAQSLPDNTKGFKTEAKDKSVPPQNSQPLPRQQLPLQSNLNEDFLVHHLKYELSLTKFASMRRIRRRQIMEHTWLQSQWQNFVGPRGLKINFGAFSESMVSAWIQRTFLDIWEEAHDDFFNKHLDYKLTRYKVAEQYMHELYQLKQFADSGEATLNFMFVDTQFDLNTFLQYSDDALLHLFKKLKDRYPQTSSKDEMQFPDVPTTKTSINILDNFPAISFSDPSNLNYQTIYEDINFLLTKAMEEQDSFKQDMKDILGADVMGCTKVGQVTKDGKTSFNACAVRRVFVKWAENILEKCPDLYETRSFMKFVQTRGKIANNFIFKSTVQDSTHKFVIDCVSLLLEVAKFSLKDSSDIQRREDFIFNIYDLLRCKIKRGSPTEIVNLLQKMKATKVTKNGKKFEVIRVKNRFKTNNRDLLVNFRYGDVIIGEAQLCVDNSQLSKQAKLNYDFCHYIYQLERSIFGPTLELMMEYEDWQRPDIAVTFEAEDLVQARGVQTIKQLKPIQRKCIQGHKMVSLEGNVVFSIMNDSDPQQDLNRITITCNYCDSKHPVTKPYDYCYLCGCVLCVDCRQPYAKADRSQFSLSVQSKTMIPEITSLKQLQILCGSSKSLIVLFWLPNSSASEMLRDGLIYQQCKQMMQLGKYVPKVASVQYSKTEAAVEIISRYKINHFPTLVLFDQNAAPCRTVIGCSWFQVPVLYQLQKEMVWHNNPPIATNYCTEYSCKKQMFLKEVNQEDVCQSCFGFSKLYHFPKQMRNLGLFCEGGHYKCLNCSYVSFDQPTVHQDFMGYSYLSSSFVSPLIEKCPKGHQITVSREDYPKEFVFRCFGCQQQRYVNNEHGIGECKACKLKFCDKCLGVNQPNLQQLQSHFQLISHTVESTAEDCYRCVCKRLFKKTYQVRHLTQQALVAKQDNTWNCKICENQHKEGQLHIACFCCPVLSEEKGQPSHFQICYPCAIKANILKKKNAKKNNQVNSYFVCPNDGEQMVVTSRGYTKTLTFDCLFCSNRFYRQTERYHCKKCRTNVCKACKQQLQKQHFKPPGCSQTCPKSHPLQFEFVKSDKHLEFCDGCMATLFEEKFECREDGYALCTNCTKNNPGEFKGTALKKMREITETLVGFFSAQIAQK